MYYNRLKAHLRLTFLKFKFWAYNRYLKSLIVLSWVFKWLGFSETARRLATHSYDRSMAMYQELLKALYEPQKWVQGP